MSTSVVVVVMAHESFFCCLQPVLKMCCIGEEMFLGQV